MVKLEYRHQEELIRNNAWCSYRRQAGNRKGGNIMFVGGIILGVACAMYAGAVMTMEDTLEDK